MKHEIDIPVLPEGWEPVEFRCPKDGESYVGYDGKVIISLSTNDLHGPRLIVKKKQPRRIVLEETDEYINGENSGYVLLDGKTIDFIRPGQSLSPEHKIWREVKETDLSLHNADDKESLRLSLDECEKIYQSLCNHRAMVDTLVLHKLRDFLKDKR